MSRYYDTESCKIYSMLAILLEMLDSWNMKALWSFRRPGTTHPTTQRHIAQELNLLLKLIVNLNAPFQHEDSFTKCQIAGTLFASSFLLARLRLFLGEFLRICMCWAVTLCWMSVSGCVEGSHCLHLKGFKNSRKVWRDRDPSNSLHPPMQCCMCFCKMACKIEQMA